MNASPSFSACRSQDVRSLAVRPPIRAADLLWTFLTIWCCMTGVASGQVFGNFTYTDDGTSITITDYPETATGVVVIPDTIAGKPVTAIGANAFQFCVGITSATIPASVTSIGVSAFDGCSALTSAPIPSGVTTLQPYAFKDCAALAAMELPSGLTSVEVGLFTKCVGLASVIIPPTVTNIKDNAFTGCKALVAVSLPSGLTTIGFGAFSNCGGLTSLTIPAGVTAIAVGAFSSSNALTSIVFQGPVTTIGTNAFLYCSQLSNFTIPATVTNIGRGAFGGCSALQSIHIPPNVNTIGTASAPNIFIDCSALTSITVDPANQNFSSVAGVLMNKSQSILITYPKGLSGAFLIPSSVTGISIQAFANCDKLTAVTMPSGLANIASKAFSGCSMLSVANFTGNAPATMSGNAFELCASNFAVYYPSTATGFTSPTWFGYPAFAVTGVDPVVAWLTTHQLPADSDLKSDLDGDGVSLLMAYALNLNPNQNLSGALPQPVLTTSQMSLSFYAGAAGIAYMVESSTDLQFWSTSGVSVSAPDANQIRTATVGNAATSRFMRLVVRR